MSDDNRKAWEIARDLFENAGPVVRTQEEQTWEDGSAEAWRRFRRSSNIRFLKS